MVAKVTLMVVLVRNSGLVANVIVVTAAGHIYLFRRGASVAESLHIVQASYQFPIASSLPLASRSALQIPPGRLF